MRPDVEANECAAALRILQEAAEPIVAADLAGKLRLSGARETQRRHVRAIIKKLRETGSWIVATLQGGYWLTDDDSMWLDYQEDRKIDAKRILGQSHKRQKAITDNKGQGLLFPPGGVATGIG